MCIRVRLCDVDTHAGSLCACVTALVMAGSLLGIVSEPLSLSLNNQAFAPGFVLLLIRGSVEEEEEETEAGRGSAAERDLPHHLA